MTDLAGRHIFLAASFPSGIRGREVEPHDADAIADAVTALVRAILLTRGRLLFGGHPTITPLVLSIGMELDVRGAVDIFQSRWFADEITPETTRLLESEIGHLHWTERRDTRELSLAEMRRKMFAFEEPLAAVFVGGMDGLYEEFDLVAEARPGLPRIPLVGPGGAAARLKEKAADLPQALRDQLGSRHYPFLAARIVEVVSELAAGRR